MRKPLNFIVLLAFATLFTCCKSQVSSISLIDYNEELTTEWNDGKLWAYNNDDDYVVGMAIGTPKDDIGVFQMHILIRNMSDTSLTFDPAQISVRLSDGENVENLKIYEYPLRQNRGMSLYNEGENIYLMTKMSEYEENVKQIGYLQKNTIYAKQGIVGYLNFERHNNGTLVVGIPVGGNIYTFQWNVGAKMPQAVAVKNYKTFLNNKGDAETITRDGKLWAFRKTDSHIVGMALSTSEDNGRHIVDLYIENLADNSLNFNPANITAKVAWGKEIVPLKLYGNPLTIYDKDKSLPKQQNIHDGKINIKELHYMEMQPTIINGGQGIIGFINLEKFKPKSWRNAREIIFINIPVGNENYQFQWDISGTKKQIISRV